MRTIKLHSFTDAVCLAKKAPGTVYVGMIFPPPYDFLKTYSIEGTSHPLDEAPQVGVYYEGGFLFKSDGEEEFFDSDDAPLEAMNLLYANQNDITTGERVISGLTSEHVLCAVLPGLIDETVGKTPAQFKQIAGAIFERFWQI